MFSNKRIVNDLYNFYKLFVINHFTKKVIPAPHIRRLSKELMRMYRGDYQKLTVSLPPRHSKSSLITIAYPIWLILNDPSLNILVVNSTATLSEQFGIRIRDVFKTYGEYFGVDVSLVKSASNWLMFEDKNGLTGGSIRLTGVGGQITGFDADYIFIDDLLKGNDLTPTQIDKTNDYYNTILMQRVEPQTRVVTLGTRWVSNDILGELRTKHSDEYKIIDLPAVNPDGSVLWDRFQPEYFEEQEKAIGTRMYQALYQCNPLDETGDYFNIDNIFYDDPYDHMTSHIIGKCRSWDLAYTAEDENKSSDYTAGAYIYKNYKNEYILSDLVYGKFGEENINKIRATAKRDGVDAPILVETGTVGGASEMLYHEYKKKLPGYNMKQSLPIGSKIDRAFTLQQAILDRRFGITIYDDKLREEVLKQLKAFPNGKNDDIIDAISYAVSYLEPVNMQSSVGVSGTKRRHFRR